MKTVCWALPKKLARHNVGKQTIINYFSELLINNLLSIIMEYFSADSDEDDVEEHAI